MLRDEYARLRKYRYCGVQVDRLYRNKMTNDKNECVTYNCEQTTEREREKEEEKSRNADTATATQA